MNHQAIQIAEQADERATRETLPVGSDGEALRIWFEVDAILRKNDGMSEKEACLRAGVPLSDYLWAKTRSMGPLDGKRGRRSTRKKAPPLPPEVVRAIRIRYDRGDDAREIAVAFGCCVNSVHNIGLRRSRKEVL